VGIKQDDKLTSMRARNWLYSYAKKNDIKITEFASDDGSHFCHLEGDRHRSVTAVSNEKTLSLLMAFLNLLDKKMNFLELE
jgi:hypothetical protein